MMTTVCIMLSIAIYLIGMILIGFRYSSGNNTSEDFFLGGRKLGPFVTALSTEASDMSAYLLMGLPGLAYFCGLAEVTWTAIGLGIGTYINWILVAKRLRVYSARIDAITVPDFLGKRFGDKSGLLEGISALIIIIFFVPYTASGFVACGKLFSSLFNANYYVAMIVSSIVIVAYTTMGGFMAASVTSLIQALVMTAALIAVLVFGIVSVGGWSNVIQYAQQVPGYFSLTSSTSIFTAASDVGKFGFIPIVSTLAWGLGYFGMPHVLLHFMAAENKEELTMSRRVGTVWVFVSMAVAVIVGLVGYAMSMSGLIDLQETASGAENIIVNISAFMSTHSVILAIVCGLILAGILAATMSTADAQLLCAASSITHNILKGVFHVELDEKKNITIARLTVIGVALVGFFFALNPNGNIFRIVSFAWAGFGATFGPLMLFGLFWKRANKEGAIAGLVAGALMVFVWKYLVRPIGGAWNIYELLPAFIVNCIVLVVVSLCTKAPDDEVVADFVAVQAEL